jgi:hypothetical protein
MLLARRFAAVLPALVLLNAIPAGSLPGQEPGRIVGTVVDVASGKGVPNVQVRLLEPVNATVIANSDGRFVFASVPPGVQELEVSHIAYGTRRELVNVPADRTVEIRLEMAQEAIDVGVVRVQVSIREPGLELAGYYDRVRRGFGHFFDPEDLRRRSFRSILQEVPRLHLAGNGFQYTPVFMRGARWCRPVVWVDNRRMRILEGGLEGMVNPYYVSAVEVYRPGETPGQFMELGRDCGAIVIWTPSSVK